MAGDASAESPPSPAGDLPAVSIVVPLWPDRPPAENLEVARLADRAGIGEIWIGEMATYDAVALATAIGSSGPGARLTIGPLAVHVRTPLTMALGVASVADLTGREVGLAVGTSSPVVVEQWHRRPRRAPARTLADTVERVRAILAGERTDGFRLRLTPRPETPITVAAFGTRAVGVAARHADRMVLNLVTPDAAARLCARLAEAARDAGRSRPPVAAWVPVAVDPTPAAFDQLRGALLAYLAAPGYGEMLGSAGLTAAVEAARAGAHPRDLVGLMPDEAVAAVAAVGSPGAVLERLRAYRAAGVDEVAVVPVTAGDEAGARTIAALGEAVGGHR